ncbi:MAG: 2-oxoglutarate dehydrogenase E1 component [Gemmatimonadetes bacterium]|nr:2-oxoglutarate dehydrogenase E1 component [Gemmatimonadota bacterium]
MDEKPFDSQNAPYAQALYEEFARNPEGVPEAWRKFFDLGPEVAVDAGLIVPEGLDEKGGEGGHPQSSTESPKAADELTAARQETDRMRRLLRVVAHATSFIQAYRVHGHQLSTIDPLGSDPPGHPQLDPSFFGTSLEELRELPASLVVENGRDESLADVLHRLHQAYCGTIGYEFEHLEDPTVVRWLWDQVESGTHTRPLEPGDRVRLLQRLTEVESLEQFLHRSYLGQKRFSIEGTDVLVPMLDLVLQESANTGGRRVVLGMSHRGRLNVLAHIVGLGYEGIIREFEGIEAKGAFTVEGTGDVKYHQGAQGERSLPDGSTIHITLPPNPSHLEFVNPVVEGMTRRLQYTGYDQDAEQDTAAVVAILIHGDAAFAGEGVVAETLNLGRLEGYTTGGTVHIIVDNQIGFTTLPVHGRSTRYASDLAKGFSVPIIHVNADDPEACLAAVRLAMAYRAEYHDDVVIDLVGYRRYGHNEGDEPAYTQPLATEAIAKHPTVRALYGDLLVRQDVLTIHDVETMQERVAEYLRDARQKVQSEGESRTELSDGLVLETDRVAPPDVSLEVLAEINVAALATPEGFTLHPKLERVLARRVEDFGPDLPVDWAHAEALAFGSLLREEIPIRLTGQDTQRGTFSHRHLVFHDVNTGLEHKPLADFGNARFEVHNSPLSEMAVLGFEYGFSVASRRALVLWEAQFGDFVNAAQVTVDQFVASGWEKWGQLASLVMLLPHGYEGQGPEHSSARLERFLQLCAEDNMRVVSPSTPAQYYHLLRRQAHQRPQRPLVVMSPKSLLRHPMATSRVSDLCNGRFQPVLDDPAFLDPGDRDPTKPDPDPTTSGPDDIDRPDLDAQGVEGLILDRLAVTRLILCSGKLFYDLAGSDLREGARNIAIARLEELYPFPSSETQQLVARYPNLQEVVWVQEEPRNMGALAFVGPRLRTVVPREVKLDYVSRPEHASPAEGRHIDHVVEQARVIREALGEPSPQEP